jgi:hypothetical protein
VLWLVVSPLPHPAREIEPNRAKNINARFKQRTPEQMDFEDAGKADYNIARGGGSGCCYGKVPEKQLNVVLR